MTKIVVILPDTEWPRNFLFVIKGNLAYKDRHVKGWSVKGKRQSYDQRMLGYNPGGYSCEYLVGVCRPVLQILTLFQTKNLSFSTTFSDLAFEIHTRFQT